MGDDEIDKMKMNGILTFKKSNNNVARGSRRPRRAHSRSQWTRSSVRGVIGICFCYSLILISIVRCSESSVHASSSSSPASTKAIASKTKTRREKAKDQTTLQIHENRHLRPSSSSIVRNPFKSERTIVSGFGSRSLRKTIFSRRSSIPNKKTTTKRKRIEKDDETDEKDDNDYLLPSMKSPKMWVQRPKFSDGSKEDDVLWMLVKDDESPKGATSNDVDRHVVLKLTFDDEKDDWVAKRATRNEESNFVRDHPLDKWIPIEGLYGTYRVPSGVLWILIAGTEAVYEAPPIPSASPTSTKTSSVPWWQIRRVTNLEIVHLGNKGYHLPETTATTTTSSRSKLTIAQSKSTLLTASRLREEVRQIRLLRKALKQHEFYYVPNSSSQNNNDGNNNQQVVKDMTKSLQRSILEANTSREGSKQRAWWKSSEGNEEEETNLLPDRRFFWNQHAVEPMLRRYKESSQNEKDSQQKEQITDLLLQHIVPITSAFVGIQKNITVSSDENAVTSYDEILISRRSRFRAGTRFTVRGADAMGDCANFAETEQICLTTTMQTTTPTKGETKSNDGIIDESSRCLLSVASHVQTRGSIPLRWSSPADVKTYRPRVNISADPLAQARAVRLHILDQLGHYALKENENETTSGRGEKSPGVADIVFVNLVDKHSDQGRLGRAFDEVLQAVVDVHASDDSSTSSQPNEPDNEPTASSLPRKIMPAKIGSDSVKHVWYDFHAEVKNGRWDRLGLLLDEIQPSLTSHGYFMAYPPSENRDGDSSEPNEWSVQRLQNAVVRTNCMDCLDRSNVVQSIFGRYILFQQLSYLAGESSLETKAQKLWAGLNELFRKKSSMALPWDAGEVSHRLLWADNADAISRLYAGTPALKGDFTRTGKRTKKGALDDGMNSLQRYYLNNFLDADRQEGYDLLVGHAIFSNVIEQDDPADDDAETPEPTTNPSNSPLTFLGGTRERILSDVVEGSSYQDREDLRDCLEEIGVSRQPPDLDLRWLPGDLQTQVRDQASEASSNHDQGCEENDVSPASAATINEGAFSSQQAMKAIDERSNVELPWWSNSDEDWLEVGSEDDDDDDEPQETNGIAINESSQHRGQVILTPVELAMVLYLGLKAPTILGSLALAILSFVYLPDCIKHDYEQQKSFRSYIENRLNEEKENSIYNETQ
jgi:hypothetical protein